MRFAQLFKTLILLGDVHEKKKKLRTSGFNTRKQRTPGGPVSPMLAALLGTLSLGQSNYCMKYDDVVANYCPSRACVTYRCEQQKQGQVVILASSGPFPPPLLAHSQAAPPPQPHPRALPLLYPPAL